MIDVGKQPGAILLAPLPAPRICNRTGPGPRPPVAPCPPLITIERHFSATAAGTTWSRTSKSFVDRTALPMYSPGAHWPQKAPEERERAAADVTRGRVPPDGSYLAVYNSGPFALYWSHGSVFTRPLFIVGVHLLLRDAQNGASGFRRQACTRRQCRRRLGTPVLCRFHRAAVYRHS